MKALRLALVTVGLAAAVLLVAGARPAEASAITCSFGTGGPNVCPGADHTDNVFDFGLYALELNFTTLNNNFDVTVTDVPLSYQLPPGKQCLNLTGLSDGCREFDITTSAGASWTGPIVVTLSWLRDTSTIFPNGTTDQVRLLHRHGDVITDVTIAGSYFEIPPAACGNNGHPNNPDPNPDQGCDPGVSGDIESFSDVTGAWDETDTVSAVPEPGTMLLLGSGLFGIAAAARRRARRA